MAENRRSIRARGLLVVVVVGLAAFPQTAAIRGDTVVLKNGITYRGTIDRDNTIVWVYDGLKRVVLRDSKVAKVESDASFRILETFRIEQPLTVHGGSMPKEVVSVQAEPWNEKGRRQFAYEGARQGRLVRMEQAINELGPYLVKLRGVDGFWQSQLATSQVPKEVVLAILAKVQRDDKNERIRVARFLIQAAWYAEARAELDRIVKDFPDDADLRERVAAARASVVQLEAERTRSDILRARETQRPRQAAALLKGFPTRDVSSELISEVQEMTRAEDAQTASDKLLADDLRSLGDALDAAEKPRWKAPLLEALRGMEQAPDAVRDRFVAWRKARLEGSRSTKAQLALAMSGYVVGADAATEDLDQASTLWSMRDLVRTYLKSTDSGLREESLAKLDSATLPTDESTPVEVKKADTVTRLYQLMTPPLHEDEPAARAAAPKLLRVRDDENVAPTEYMVSLPAEYHPLRRYPAVVALHDGTGPESAIKWWSAEASRHGYIVIAPEYKVPGQGKDYQYTTSEHAAVELALRDARRRYSIDDDRVFLGGQLTGANMAWDLGLAHPDLFAGVVIVSGLPFKYVNRYLPHAERLPLYVALGDLAPAGNEVVFGQILKPLISRAWDVTYLEYFRRGLEDLPEEAPAALDWMDRRRRDPFPKSFDVVTARTCDNRFYGVVVRDFQAGRTTDPAAVEPFGQNLKPASIKLRSSSLSNLLTIQSTGLRKLDVWLSPKMIDFKKRAEVRINGRSYYKGLAKPDLGPVLEDFRLRADRKQVYWMKVAAG